MKRNLKTCHLLSFDKNNLYKTQKIRFKFLRALKLRYERFVQIKRIDKRWVSDQLYRWFMNVSSVFSLCYEISIIGKAFQKYKRPQGRAGHQTIHEFISKGKILLDLLLLKCLCIGCFRRRRFR